MIDKHLQNLNRQGRKKGQKNKFTQAKEDFLWAYRKMGGRQELFAWGIISKNRDSFYDKLIKLLPREILIAGDVNLGTRVIYLPQRQFSDGQVVTIEAKQAITTPGNGDKQGATVPLLEHKPKIITKAIKDGVSD